MNTTEWREIPVLETTSDGSQRPFPGVRMYRNTTGTRRVLLVRYDPQAVSVEQVSEWVRGYGLANVALIITFADPHLATGAENSQSTIKILLRKLFRGSEVEGNPFNQP